MTPRPSLADIKCRAALASVLLSIEPHGLGGILMRAPPGPALDLWLANLRTALGAIPVRRMPAHVSEDRLVGGLDLASTLFAGRPVAERGLLCETDGGVLILPTAERLDPGKAASIAAAIDLGMVGIERNGISLNLPARIAVIALDESSADEERIAPILLERLTFHLDESALDHLDDMNWEGLAPHVDRARNVLPRVEIGDDAIEALCAASIALGVASLRGPLMAARVARVCAAWDDRTTTNEDDLRIAAAMVLASRATRIPADPDAQAEPPEQPPAQPEDGQHHADSVEDSRAPLEDMVLEAAAAAIPAALLRDLADGTRTRRTHACGRQGHMQKTHGRGRPAGSRAGKLKSGERLNILETLRAAAPWQRLRRDAHGRPPADNPRIIVKATDFRIQKRKHPAESATIFAVDASGSHALHRLAEAKGAIELLLSQCYVRRDRVALVSFRGKSADLLLSPTRSLARAKRTLSSLPGGGATPLAAGLDAAAAIALQERKRGASPTIVVLTDGKANVDRLGNKSRSAGEADALAAGRGVRAIGLRALLVDTSPQRHVQARALAEAMGARYLPLPHADAAAVTHAVRLAVEVG